MRKAICASSSESATPARTAHALLAHDNCLSLPLRKTLPSKEVLRIAERSFEASSEAGMLEDSDKATVGSGLPNTEARSTSALRAKMKIDWIATDFSSFSCPAHARAKPVSR